MQEDSRTGKRTIPAAPARHRRSRRGGRGLIVGAVALVGLGVAGAATVAFDSADTPTATTVSLDARARAEAVDQADRSAREATVSLSPPAAPIPTAAGPSASPSPTATKKATTPLPTPKKSRKPTPKPAPSWVIPMKGAQVTSCYGPRGGTLHAGIDFAMPAGTPVRAAFGGTIEKAGDVGDGYGISVVVNHGNGYLTHYAHLSAAKVSVGDRVAAGQVIGLEGSTGDSTGPHLHFEVHQGQMWNQIDPAPFLRARGIDVAC
ncbi:peptidoglycan DD-metalloendopeptidase family protein [Micromonospora sp. KC213]|uniref:M23 family metallopeptidase n=1 Tax=Micromonospora sp. KC213 TaxID=2530378 RepID=UPI001042BF99|nr:peptidoglycan DD-metalloendopeptidase family protein [Micromonospora sp. KC213]TDC34121.1 M23 family peptidase [Micromonospora sp. KC213]